MKNDEDDFLNGLIANDEMVNSGLLVADENQLDEDLLKVEGESHGLIEEQIAFAQDPIGELDREDSDSFSSPSDHDTSN